jgi:hypothetical protein
MKALILAAALAATGAQAQQFSILYTGQELLTRMGTNPSWALGYIAGVADNAAGITICVPPSTVTLGQMHDMVKQTLESVPSERHLRADVFVEMTLSRRWPCGRRGQNL